MTSRLAGWWTTAEVLAYLASRGRVIKPVTWYAYRRREQIPEPQYAGRTPLWDPEEIRAYQDEYEARRAGRTGTEQEEEQ